MAYKLAFPTPHRGLSFIWNISQHVGSKKTCPNRPTDVELSQFFFQELFKAGVVGGDVAAGVKPPVVNGSFDATLGFWIWVEQDAPGAVKDGVMSPAKGFSYGSNVWLIVWLNYHFMKTFPDAFANLDKDPRLSMGLRAELSKTTP